MVRTRLAIPAILSVASLAGAAELYGLGALPDPLVHSQLPVAMTTDGQVIASSACEHTGPRAPCKPFLFEVGLPNQALDRLAGHVHALSWDITPDGSVVVGFSQPSTSVNAGRQAVRWIDGGPPLPLDPSPASNEESWAWRVTGDGDVIGGTWRQVSDQAAFGWSEATGFVKLLDPVGFPFLDQSNYAGTSNAGEVVAFLHEDSSPWSNGATRAVRWTPGGGLAVLGPIPTGYESTNAHDVAEGTGAIVGAIFPGDQGTTAGVAYRWTESGGFDLIPLPPPHLEAEARLVSSDGETVTGVLVNPLGSDLDREAFRWTPEQGLELLGPASGFDWTEPRGISDDGQVIFGNLRWTRTELIYDAVNAPDVYGTRRGWQSFLWKGSERIDLPDGTEVVDADCDHDFQTLVDGVSADGSLVVGRASCREPDSFVEYLDPYYGWVVDVYSGATRSAAYVWDPVGGVRTVPDYLAEEHGLDFAGWTATFAYVDGDGTVMYGERVKDFVEETWVAYLPEPGGASSLAGGVAFLAALRRRRSRR